MSSANATPDVVLPYYVDQIVWAARQARENEKIVRGGYGEDDR